MIDPKTVARALSVISKGGANHRYFFGRLNSPDWLDPLNAVGLFAQPPNAIKTDNGGIIYPVWPEGEYLARMAAVAPDKVYDIVMEIKETDNFRVHHALVLAVTQMDVDRAAKWAIRETKWIRKQPAVFFLLPEAFGKLAIHLATSGRIRVAVELMKATLSPSFKSIGFHGMNHDAWESQELLKSQYQSFTAAVGLPALNLICHLANPAFVHTDSKSDYSSIWRPAIESSDQNIISGDMTNTVIDAIRDTADNLLHQGVELDKVISEFEAHPALIFRRFALSLLAQFPTSDAAKRYVFEKFFFDDSGLWHEYSHLLTAVFGHLSSEERHRILTWIDAGPPEIAAEDISVEAIEQERRYRLSWKARRFSRIAAYLTQDWLALYESIIQQVGIPPHADFLSYSTEFVGPSTPKTTDELEAMTVEEVALFLKSWKPSGEWHSAEPEGLGRAVQAVVAKKAEQFARQLDTFIDVDPTYARCILQGFEEAQGAKDKFDWNAVLRFSLWVAAQSRTYVRDVGRLDRDPHWGWARRSLMSLLRRGLSSDAIKVDNRLVVWSIIEQVVDDADPTPDDDRATSLDALTHGINSTRGQAAQVLVEYALWIRRAEEDREHKLPNEVRGALDRRLDFHIDPSPGVRAVIAEYFPYLHLLDEEWTTANLDGIFPKEPKALRDGAWRSYIIYSKPYASPFALLRRKYSQAIDEISSENTGQYQERLGDHLLAMVGQGVLAWSDDDELLLRYFRNADAEAAARALGSVGHALRNASSEVPSDVVARFQRMWEKLVETFDSDQTKAAMFKSFGRWFAAPQFESAWALLQLRRVIEIAGNTDVDFMVVERLAGLAVHFPKESFELLRQLASGSAPHWELIGYRDSAVVILSAALRHPPIRSAAESFIHELGRRGYEEFRVLISS